MKNSIKSFIDKFFKRKIKSIVMIESIEQFYSLKLREGIINSFKKHNIFDLINSYNNLENKIFYCSNDVLNKEALKIVSSLNKYIVNLNLVGIRSSIDYKLNFGEFGEISVIVKYIIANNKYHEIEFFGNGKHKILTNL